MKCQMCGTREATVRYAEVVDGNSETLHLCEECAGERGVAGSLTSFAGPLVSMLMGLLEGSVGEERSAAAPSCPKCGLNYEDFRRTGRLGCSTCYDAFRRELKPLLRRIHGSAEHAGRMPSEIEGDYRLRRELKSLKGQLAIAVAEEDYERAAELRDDIRTQERRLDGGDATEREDVDVRDDVQ